MRVKTILNRIEKQPGFIYDHARWSADGKSIEVARRPAARTQPVCSGCGERGPGYDTLAARIFSTSWPTVFRAVEVAVQWGRERMPMDGVTALSTSFQT